MTRLIKTSLQTFISIICKIYCIYKYTIPNHRTIPAKTETRDPRQSDDFTTLPNMTIPNRSLSLSLSL